MSLEVYAAYLTTEKRMTDNTKQAYLRDLRHFSNFAEARGIDDPAEASSTDILAYLMELKTGGRSKSTVNRKLASLRTYYQYLIKMREIFENPTESIKSPKVEKKEIQYLTTEEIDRLLELPEDTAKGKRDRAILELLYATGIRASELIEMQIEEINIRMGFVKCAGTHGSARIIPIGKPCRHAMEVYVSEVRETLLKGKESESLFLNYAGNPFTRQGLWKILKEYGEAADFAIPLTPQVIRNSFAVHMLQNGADVKSLQELMGHEDISATQAYLAVVKNRIKDVYDKAHPRA